MDWNQYTLLKAQTDHYDDYFRIRSEEKNMHWTGYEKPPDYHAFRNWFTDRLKNPDRDIYLMYSEGHCVGSLHIDFYETYIDIGYSVMEAYEGKGFATSIVSEAVAIAKSEKTRRKKITTVKAWINAHNIGSIKVAEKNGFQLSENSEIRKRFGKEELYYEYTLQI